MAQQNGHVRRIFQQMSAADQYDNFKDWRNLRGYACGELAIAPVGRVTLYDEATKCAPDTSVRAWAEDLHEWQRMYLCAQWVRQRHQRHGPRLGIVMDNLGVD